VYTRALSILRISALKGQSWTDGVYFCEGVEKLGGNA